MGAKASHILSPAECRQRSPSQAERFTKVFDRLTASQPKSTRRALTQASFIRWVLQPFSIRFPKRLGARLFAAFDYDGDGAIDADEFLVGLTVLSGVGTRDEQVKFVFRVLADGGDLVYADAVQDVLTLTRTLTQRELTPVLSALARKGVDRSHGMDLAEFVEFAGELPKVWNWVLHFQPQRLQPGHDGYEHEYIPALSSRHSWLSDCLFTTQEEIQRVEKALAKAFADAPIMDGVAPATFVKRFPHVPDAISRQIACALDADRDGLLGAREIVFALSTLARGASSELISFWLASFDGDDDGKLTEDELARFHSFVALIHGAIDEFQGLTQLSGAYAFPDLELSDDDATHTPSSRSPSSPDAAEEQDAGAVHPISELVLQLLEQPDVLVALERIAQFVTIRLGIPPRSPTHEGDLLRAYMLRPLAEGDEYFLVAKEWYDSWEKYVSHVPSDDADEEVPQRPGAVDNWPIVAQKCKALVDPTKVLNEDFVAVPEPVWTAFVNWYGGGPALPRLIVPAAAGGVKPYLDDADADDNTASRSTSNNVDSALVVDVFPTRFSVETGRLSVVVPFSSYGRVGQFKRRVREALRIPRSTPIRLWLGGKSRGRIKVKGQRSVAKKGKPKAKGDNATEGLLADPNSRVGQYGVPHKGIIVVERPRNDGSWVYATRPQPKKMPDSDAKRDSRGLVKPHTGLTGMENLGNTCFLSSAVQCLSHTEPLTHYFFRDYYLKELNTHNEAAKDGAVAVEYARLLKKLWTMEGYLAPSQFKWMVGKYRPDFQGSEQQDAEELLRFVLNELHESLNRYVEDKEEIARVRAKREREAQRRKRKAEKEKRRRQRALEKRRRRAAPNHRRRGSEEDQGDDAEEEEEPQSSEEESEEDSEAEEDRAADELDKKREKEKEEEEKNMPIEERARRHWEEFSNKHNSVINDLFFFQVASKLQCNGTPPEEEEEEEEEQEQEEQEAQDEDEETPKEAQDEDTPKEMQEDDENTTAVSTETCGWSSTRFEPYSTLHLELNFPEKEFIYFEIVTSYWKQRQPRVRLGVRLPPNALVHHLHRRVAELSGIDPHRLVLADIYNHYVYTVISNPRARASQFTNLVIQAFEVFSIDDDEEDEEEDEEEVREKLLMHVVHRAEGLNPDALLKPYGMRRFGFPVVLQVPVDTPKAELYQAVWEQVEPFVRNYDVAEHGVPFTLCITNRSATACPLTPFIEAKQGFPISLEEVDDDEDAQKQKKEKKEQNSDSDEDEDDDNEAPLREHYDTVARYHGLAIDWDSHFLEDHFDFAASVAVANHPSTKEHEAFVQKPVTLEGCLRQFIKPEELEYKCERCKKNQPCSKSLMLWNSPPVLIVHLKRLLYGHKVNTYVDFPVEGLDLSEFVQDPAQETCMYDLYGVVSHLGASGYGHYVSTIKAQHDGNWYRFDDEDVREVDASAVKSASAYLLFYKRRDLVVQPEDDPQSWASMAGWHVPEDAKEQLKHFPGSEEHARAVEEAKSKRLKRSDECVIL